MANFNKENEFKPTFIRRGWWNIITIDIIRKYSTMWGASSSKFRQYWFEFR